MKRIVPDYISQLVNHMDIIHMVSNFFVNELEDVARGRLLVEKGIGDCFKLLNEPFIRLRELEHTKDTWSRPPYSNTIPVALALPGGSGGTIPAGPADTIPAGTGQAALEPTSQPPPSDGSTTPALPSDTVPPPAA